MPENQESVFEFNEASVLALAATEAVNNGDAPSAEQPTTEPSFADVVSVAPAEKNDESPAEKSDETPAESSTSDAKTEAEETAQVVEDKRKQRLKDEKGRFVSTKPKPATKQEKYVPPSQESEPDADDEEDFEIDETIEGNPHFQNLVKSLAAVTELQADIEIAKLVRTQTDEEIQNVAAKLVESRKSVEAERARRKGMTLNEYFEVEYGSFEKGMESLIEETYKSKEAKRLFDEVEANVRGSMNYAASKAKELRLAQKRAEKKAIEAQRQAKLREQEQLATKAKQMTNWIEKELSVEFMRQGYTASEYIAAAKAVLGTAKQLRSDFDLDAAKAMFRRQVAGELRPVLAKKLQESAEKIDASGKPDTKKAERPAPRLYNPMPRVDDILR